MYFDSSAITKLCMREAGSDWAAGCWEDARTIMSSVVSYAEVRAALASANRADRLGDGPHQRAKQTLDALWADISVVDCDTTLVANAGDVAERHGLRGYDSVQLASALTFSASLPLYMLTWDNDLARASFDAGLNVIRTGGA